MYRRVTFSKQVLLHSINFFRTATFWEKQILQKCNILHYLVCLESHFYRAATFSKDLTFHSCFLFQTSYFFRTYFYRRDTISQLYFFPQLHFLFISQQLCKLDTNYVQRTIKLWEFFLVYLLLPKVASETKFI